MQSAADLCAPEGSCLQMAVTSSGRYPELSGRGFVEAPPDAAPERAPTAERFRE